MQTYGKSNISQKSSPPPPSLHPPSQSIEHALNDKPSFHPTLNWLLVVVRAVLVFLLNCKKLTFSKVTLSQFECKFYFRFTWFHQSSSPCNIHNKVAKWSKTHFVAFNLNIVYGFTRLETWAYFLIIRSSVVLWGGSGNNPHYTLGDFREICWNIFTICCSDLYVTFLHVLHII